MTQMGLANWLNKWITLVRRRLIVSGLIVACFGAVAFPLAAHAQSRVTKIFLDQATRLAGYTLERGRLDLGIPAGGLTSADKVWVRRYANAPALPPELKQLSPVYSYTIHGETADWLDQPITLQYQLPGKKYTYERSFYYYDETAQEWRPLESTLQRSQRAITTQWGALHSLVVVAADTTDPFGPKLRSDAVAFGDIDAAAAVAIDVETGDILYSKNSLTRRSMASMTKLMTAYVLLNKDIDLDATATYHNSYDQIGGALHVSEGETMTMGNLMYAMVVGSANNAAYALVGNMGYTIDDFVAAMNQSASDLGLEETTFADPSGLAVENITTAEDYAKFLQIVSADEQLATMSATTWYEFTTINTGQYHDFYNTNPLLRTSTLDISASKTGYIDEAMYCLAMRVEADGHSIITVVLGAPSSSARFSESERLAKWVLTSYAW